MSGEVWVGVCVPLREEVAVVPDPASHRPVWVEESRNLPTKT
jgi:hypothetical protein